MYTDNFEEEILFIPARKDGEACNHLKIVTAFTDVERISSHLIKLFDGRNKEYVSGIKVDIILGMTKGTGLTQKKHDKICSLIKRLNRETNGHLLYSITLHISSENTLAPMPVY